MTVSSGFFNSVNHDRLYNAEQLSSIFDGVILDGVYENVGDAFEISANPDAENSIFIRTGRAWFDHTWTVNDSNMVMTLEAPNEMLPRIDAVVIDVDRRESVRANTIKVLTGSLASNPQPPSLIKEDLHNQYPIAYITRPAGSSAVISNANIENKVGTDDCPLVTGILEMSNLDNLWQQLDAEFNEWWDGIKATLDENVATNLQNQIDALDKRIDDVVANGTVGDDGVIGDYQICLTKSQVNSMINGTTGNTLSISSNTYNNLTHDFDTGSYFTVITDDLNRGVFFLPDGWICVTWFEHGKTNQGKRFHCDLISPEGVTQPNSSDMDYEPYSNYASFCVGEIDASHYPVVIPVLALTVESGLNYWEGTADFYEIYGNITVTEEHLVNFSLNKQLLQNTGDGVNDGDQTMAMVSTQLIVDDNGDRIGLVGGYDNIYPQDNRGNNAYLLRFTSDGTIQNGAKFNPQTDGSFEFDNWDYSDGAVLGYNDGVNNFFIFNNNRTWGYTINADSLTVTSRGKTYSTPSNYVNGSNATFSTFNLSQQKKKSEVYSGYLSPNNEEESFPCFLLYDRGMAFSGNDATGTMIELEDGTQDIMLHFSGNANHVHRNPFSTICVMETNLSFSGTVNLDKPKISQSANGIFNNETSQQYVWMASPATALSDDDWFAITKVVIGG